MQGAQPLKHNAYKVPLMRNLVKRAIRGVEDGYVDLLTWGRSPWGERILTHVSWDLLWASLFAGVAFLVAHASYMVLSRPPRAARGRDGRDGSGAHRPAGAHPAPLAGGPPVSLGDGGLDVRAAVTAFLPIAGVQFAWVTWHWAAGLVLTASILFHIIHASVWMDFWSIWAEKLSNSRLF